MTSAKNSLLIKKIIAGIVFAIFAFALSTVTPSIEVAWVTAILILTIYLFSFEIVDIDVAAISIMVLLGLTTLLAPFMGLTQGLVDTSNIFNGFSSNAVMSIIAVMIIGAGLDKTGLMTKVAAFILKAGGSTENRIIPIISGTVAFISSFMQNVGAAALFIPVVSRISARSGLPISRLLMPMGYCAILGGTVTMVGSSPLILLNDLIITSNASLPEDQQMEIWSLFSVTPVGIALVITGILYFVLLGRFILPKSSSESSADNKATDYFKDIYDLDYELFEVEIPEDSNLVGKKLDEIETVERIRIIASYSGGYEPGTVPDRLARDLEIRENTVLGILAEPKNLLAFVEKHELTLRNELNTFSETLSSAKSGTADIVIPPSSALIGKSARDLWMRKTYGIALVALHRDATTFREGDNIRNLPLKAGDTLIVHTNWDVLARLQKNKNFVVITTEFPHEETRPNKVGWAGLFFAIALGMVLFTDLRLSVALLTGAIGMVLSGVLTIDEAYEAISWKTVFLLASLIPLGLAVESSGTAAWIAEHTLSVVGDMPVWVIQLAIATLATFFTLVMSNVGATVLLVPLAVNIALGVDGADPAIFALTVAIATSNSFFLPTHQVNALIMGPGGYRVPDFMKAGSLMTILFLIVSITVMNLVF